MPIRKRARGSGITAYERTVVTLDGGPSAREDLFAIFSAMAFWMDPLAVVASIETRAAAILSANTSNNWEHSPADYARRILLACRLTREAIHNGQADVAAREGMRLGVLITESTMKVKWEPDALRGKKVADGARKGGRKAGSERDRDRNMADEYLNRKASGSRLSDTKLKAEIGKRYGIKQSQAVAVINRELARRNWLSNEPGLPDKI